MASALPLSVTVLGSFLLSDILRNRFSGDIDGFIRRVGLIEGLVAFIAAFFLVSSPGETTRPSTLEEGPGVSKLESAHRPNSKSGSSNLSSCLFLLLVVVRCTLLCVGAYGATILIHSRCSWLEAVSRCTVLAFINIPFFVVGNWGNDNEVCRIFFPWTPNICAETNLFQSNLDDIVSLWSLLVGSGAFLTCSGPMELDEPKLRR